METPLLSEKPNFRKQCHQILIVSINIIHEIRSSAQQQVQLLTQGSLLLSVVHLAILIASKEEAENRSYPHMWSLVFPVKHPEQGWVCGCPQWPAAKGDH